MKNSLLLFSIFFIFSCTSEETIEEPQCQETPVLSTKEVTNISETSATLNGSITPPNCYSSSMISQGFVVNDSGLPTIEDLNYKRGGNELAVEIDGLRMNEEYFVRLYYEDQNGVYYGNEISFTTSIGAVGFLPSSYSDITPISAIVNFTGRTSGGGNISESGIVYSTSSEPTVDDIKLVTQEFYGSFQLENLTPDTTYYFRPFGVNEVGLFYGDEVSFTTLDGEVEFSFSFSKIRTDRLEYNYLMIDDGGYGDLITSQGFYFVNSAEELIVNQQGTISGLSEDTIYSIIPFYEVKESNIIRLDEIEVRTAPTNIVLEIRNLNVSFEEPYLNEDSQRNLYGDFYNIMKVTADIFVNTDLIYLENGYLCFSQSFQSEQCGSGNGFWIYDLDLYNNPNYDFERNSQGTTALNVGEGSARGGRFFVNDGDGKYDFTYYFRAYATDHSGNIFYSEIIKIIVPDYNP